MPVSYMLDMEQLSVLSYYSGADGFLCLPDFPAMDVERRDVILKKLAGLGMVHLHGAEASVDLGLAFVLSAMAKPELIARMADGILCCCTKNLGIVVSPDEHAKNRFRVTPLPDAAELARHMWESSGTGDEYRDLALWKAAGCPEQLRMSKAEFEKLIAQVYVEAPIK